MGSSSQGDLEEMPQPIHISMFPIHRRKSTITLTYLREAQIWLSRAWKGCRTLPRDRGGQRLRSYRSPQQSGVPEKHASRF